jgi:O-antigen ligase
MSTSAGISGRGSASWPLLADAAEASFLRTRASEVPRLLLLAWAALFFNVLTPSNVATIIPVPHILTQVLAQGSLPVSVVLALLVNPRIVIRPNAFLVLLTAMAVVALAVSLHSQFVLGSTYRSLRLIGFIGCLWLLSPWWGVRDLVLLRIHRLCLWVALIPVALGALVAPGKAFAFEGRLAGVIWPMWPTAVAHYAAVLLGTSVVLWMCRVISGRHALLGVVLCTACLIGTHTRTAVLGTIIGLAVAAGSLFLRHARVRRTSASALVAIIVGATFFAPQVLHWAARGQSAEEASQLTGRATVWAAVSDTSRPRAEELFGSGLSDKSFSGLSVDSSWVATYLDLGWFGIVLLVTYLCVLLTMAATHPKGPRRAIALFLITYCIVSSITETGLGDASPYLLDLVVAASLVVPAPRGVVR